MPPPNRTEGHLADRLCRRQYASCGHTGFSCLNLKLHRSTCICATTLFKLTCAPGDLNILRTVGTQYNFQNKNACASLCVT